MSATFQHLGLMITEKADIREFYQEILGMEIQREFTLKSELAGQIFNRDRDINIVAGRIGNLFVEIFLADEKPDAAWEHICLITENRAELIAACRANKYAVLVIKKEPFDLVFIRDRSGNLFEIKEVQA